MDAFTEAEIERFRAEAGIMLSQFAAYVASPHRSPPSGWAWWGGVWQGVVASWGYALSIIAAAGLFRVFGSDIITAAEWVGRQAALNAAERRPRRRRQR